MGTEHKKKAANAKTAAAVFDKKIFLPGPGCRQKKHFNQ
jgi:hypothetical protein